MTNSKLGVVAGNFWANVDKTPGQGPKGDCWEWTAGTGKHGYGITVRRTLLGRKHLLAHRVAWELINGPIPAGKEMLHSCDNKICCNPGYLNPGTRLQNVHDAMANGIHPHGETNGQHKLTWEDVENIRREYADGNKSMTALARERKMARQSISDIVRGKAWIK